MCLSHAIAVDLILQYFLLNDLLLEFEQIYAVYKVLSWYEVAFAGLARALDRNRPNFPVFKDLIEAKQLILAKDHKSQDFDASSILKSDRGTWYSDCATIDLF